LEPGTVARPARRRRSVWPWIALSALIVTGGAVAVLLLLDRGSARRSQPFPHLEPLTEVSAGALTIYLADGSVAAADVATGYAREVKAVQDRVNEVLRKQARKDIQLDPLDAIFVIPQSALCTREA